jgi:hypothetical protein
VPGVGVVGVARVRTMLVWCAAAMCVRDIVVLVIVHRWTSISVSDVTLLDSVQSTPDAEPGARMSRFRAG